MDIKQIITATVAVILICLVAIPLVDASTETVKTSMNNVAERYMMAQSTTGDITIEATESATTFIINGKSITFESGNYSDFYAIITNNLFIRLNVNGAFVYFDGWGSGGTTLGTDGKIEINSSGWTVNLPSGTAPGTYSKSYDWICYPNENGNYGVYRFTGNYYVDNDATVFSVKESNTLSNGVMTLPSAIWSGSIDGGTESLYAWNSTTTPPTDVSSTTEISMEYTEKGEISTKVNRIVMKYGENSVGIATAIIPIEYHVITENDSTIRTILQLVPVMLIVSLVLGIGYTIARRD